MMQSLRMSQLRRSFAVAAGGGGLVLCVLMSYSLWNQEYWKKAEDATMAMDFEGFGPERGWSLKFKKRSNALGID